MCRNFFPPPLGSATAGSRWTLLGLGSGHRDFSLASLANKQLNRDISSNVIFL